MGRDSPDTPHPGVDPVQSRTVVGNGLTRSPSTLDQIFQPDLPDSAIVGSMSQPTLQNIAGGIVSPTESNYSNSTITQRSLALPSGRADGTGTNDKDVRSWRGQDRYPDSVSKQHDLGQPRLPTEDNDKPPEVYPEGHMHITSPPTPPALPTVPSSSKPTFLEEEDIPDQSLLELKITGEALLKNLQADCTTSKQAIDMNGGIDLSAYHYRASEPLTPGLQHALARSEAFSVHQRPILSRAPSSAVMGKSTIDLPSTARNPDDCINSSDLITLLTAESYLERTAPVLIVDTRPLSQYLHSHLVRSVNVTIPSLILRRCERNIMMARKDCADNPPSAGDVNKIVDEEKHILPGGWHALKGYISTVAGRKYWQDCELGVKETSSNRLDIVVLNDATDDFIGRVIEEIIRDLCGNDGLWRVKWLIGGWSVELQAAGSNLLRQGDSPEPILSNHVRRETFSCESPTLLSITQFSPTDTSMGTKRSLPSLPSLRLPDGPISQSLPALGPYPIASGTEPETDVSLLGLLSPPLIGPNRSRRKTPTPIRINTLNSGVPSPKSGRNPLTLRIQAPSINLVVSNPLKSASLSTPSTAIDSATRFRSASGNATFLQPVDREAHHTAQENISPTAMYGNAVQRPLSATSMDMNGQVYISSSTSPIAASDTGQQYSISPGDLDSEDEGGRLSSFMAFTVSTILPSFLFLGPDITKEEDVQQLLKLGIRRILNVAVECDEADRLNLNNRFERYLQLPLRDSVEETGIRKGVIDACKFIDDARLHSAPTYVHCKAGKSRSVTVVLGYLIHANAWTLRNSYAYVARRRKGISPNIGFVAELMQFEEGELGLKASTGIAAQSGDSSEESSPVTSRYARDSLPPTWDSTRSIEIRDRDRDTPTPRQAAMQSSNTSIENLAAQRGMNKEIRRNGQYVHSRRVPVNKHTLQPSRRFSKAGLEGTAQLSPTEFKQREAMTPSEEPDRDGWLRHGRSD